MKPRWDDVNARARGLGTRLLGRARLERLASAANLTELAAGLEREGYPFVSARTATPFELERSIRRGAQQHLGLVARWCGLRTRFLRFLFEDEDRRSLRALVRGALQGASSERRLSGLVPTPSLPERTLEELSRMSTVSEIAATLVAWSHPYGDAIRVEASRSQVDLFQLELEVNRLFARRARTAVRWRGGELRGIVRESIDLENALAAIVLSRHETDVDPGACFLEGGRLVDLGRFVETAGSGDVAPLASAFAATPYAPVFVNEGGRPEDVESSLLRERLGLYLSRARGEPLSVAPLFAYTLRLRAEAVDLRGLIWARALGAPRAVPDWVSLR